MSKLNVMKKDDPKTVLFTSDTDVVSITGLAAGTVVKDGDYVVEHDGITTDVQGFTVTAAAPQSASVKATKAKATTKDAK